MPSLTLRGVSVEFPFTPYPCQTDYMNKVIECLQNKVNGVLESPTGTGKTLCLLCATLGWRAYFKDSISARKITERMGGAELFPDRPVSSWGTSATDGETTAYYTDIPKIIYASRTHSQLTQVISELKNTTYRPKICVLGSREQLCINQEVMKQESNHIKVHMCRAKVSSRSCVFYNNVDEKSTDKDIVNSILDVEDLVKAGKKQRVCPYYLSRSLKQHADLIFMPYNYLLDPKSRRAHNIELKGAVVIFDEAHNVEKMCEESTSFDLTPYDLTSAIDAVDKLLREQASDIGKGESSDNFGGESLSSGLNLDITTIAKIKQILMDLEITINNFEMPPNNQGITKPGSFIYELFQKAHVNYDTKTAIVDAMEQITGYLAAKPGIFLNTSGLQKVADIIQLVFAVEPADGAVHKANDMKQFKVHIHPDTSSFKKKQSMDVWASSSARKQGNVLSYWCFSPGFSMQDLLRQEVRCIILTSGTLSPLSSFTCEMQIPFPVSLENPHVIQKDQIFVSIIDKGPDGVRLSAAFDRRFVPENMASLGNTIVNLSRVVPHGLLVFFPSYPVLDKTLDYWRASGHVDRIESMKPMFVEPKGKGTFTEVIDGFYDKVNDSKSNGGSFFAVCRGKVSEGLDFADTYGRGVIITGLPYPPRMDPKVVLKMQYLDEMCRNKTSGVKYLSGQEWYRQQASRAVNQAIGRVIRHRDDYGAIFLCDYRFKNSDVRQQLPSWVRPYVRTHENFGTVVRDAAQFFRVAQKLRPVPEKKKLKGSECESQTGKSDSQTSPGCSRGAQSAWDCSSSLKAKVFDSHVPSLKKRKLDERCESDGTAKLCVQYEMEMNSSKKRPMSLLDALDKSDPNRDEDDSLVGEEKASRLSTLSLQHDKRLDDELRGGKRKIRVVQDRKPPDSSAAGRGKAFMMELRRCLSQESYVQVINALQEYKATDNLENLLAKTTDILIQDRNTHNLLRGVYQFVRPHHKKQFDEQCRLLTGKGCGYKTEHSISREERALLMKQTAKVESSETCSSAQLDTSKQLNQGGSHLGTQQMSETSVKDQNPRQSEKESPFSASLLSDIKKEVGAEKTSRLFSALKQYRQTNDYEQMVSTVVGLLTERDQDIALLKRLKGFIPAHHRQQFSEMLTSLTGSVSDPYQDSDEVSSPPASVSQLCSEKSQSKISSFFS